MKCLNAVFYFTFVKIKINLGHLFSSVLHTRVHAHADTHTVHAHLKCNGCHFCTHRQVYSLDFQEFSWDTSITVCRVLPLNCISVTSNLPRLDCTGSLMDAIILLVMWMRLETSESSFTFFTLSSSNHDLSPSLPFLHLCLAPFSRRSQYPQLSSPPT